MAAQFCMRSTDANSEKKPIFFRNRNHPSDTHIRWWTHFQGIHIQTRRSCDITDMTTLRGLLPSAVGPIPETDTTVACQSSNTKVFASGGSFQDVCGELQRPPLHLTVCGNRFVTPQTLTFAVILPLPSLYSGRHWPLPDSWLWTHRSFKCHFLQQNLLYSHRSLPFASSYAVSYTHLTLPTRRTV